jgi:NADH:ubiquinone oxidoreductase subunit B-like Fe-S oxidoreductase
MSKAPSIFLTSLQELYKRGIEKFRLPLQFGLACCAIEMIAAVWLGLICAVWF